MTRTKIATIVLLAAALILGAVSGYVLGRPKAELRDTRLNVTASWQSVDIYGAPRCNDRLACLAAFAGTERPTRVSIKLVAFSALHASKTPACLPDRQLPYITVRDYSFDGYISSLLLLGAPLMCPAYNSPVATNTERGANWLRSDVSGVLEIANGLSFAFIPAGSADFEKYQDVRCVILVDDHASGVPKLLDAADLCVILFHFRRQP